MSNHNPELRSIPGIMNRQRSTHILLDDCLRHEQTDPRSLVRTLGGKVGIKQFVNDLIVDASCIIGNGYHSCFSFRKRTDRNQRIVNVLSNKCVTGIHKDVQDDLGEFVRIAGDLRGIFMVVYNTDLLILETLFDESNRLTDHQVYIKSNYFLVGTKEISEVID